MDLVNTVVLFVTRFILALLPFASRLELVTTVIGLIGLDWPVGRCTVVPAVSVSWTDRISFALVGQTALVEQMIVTHNIL